MSDRESTRMELATEARNRNLRVVIVDDEEPSRARLRSILAPEPGVEIIAEADNGLDAIGILERERPDLAFMDVQMPELDGFEVLDSLEDSVETRIIFVTGHDHFAARAFDVHAVDYVLKPISRERVIRALDHARRQMPVPAEDANDAVRRVVRENLDDRTMDRFLVKDKDRLFFVDTADVEIVEAAGNYVRVRTATSRYLIRQTLQRVEERLDPSFFCRIHRSVIVNLRRIRELYPLSHGNYTVVLESGRTVTMTRNYRKQLEEHWSL